jgi:hypothetical protein
MQCCSRNPGYRRFTLIARHPFTARLMAVDAKFARIAKEKIRSAVRAQAEAQESLTKQLEVRA